MKSGPTGHYENIEQLIAQYLSQYNDVIDFTNATYKNSSSRLHLRCKIHDKEFHNTSYHVLKGAGCRECRREKIHRAADKKRLGNSGFIERSNKVHNGKYDYSLVEYKSLTTNVDIICNDHGIFSQKPREHFRGNGCQICAHRSVSIIGKQWLDSLSIEDLDYEYRIDYNSKWYFVDGFSAKTNTVYEFYGDFWHGNPVTMLPEKINSMIKKTFGELYRQTIERETIIKNLGYNVISIWESEYHEKTIR